MVVKLLRMANNYVHEDAFSVEILCAVCKCGFVGVLFYPISS